jgi:hypothetical protein
VEPTIVFSIGGAFGYLIRLFVEHFLSKDRSRQDRIAAIFNSGAIAFKNAFIEEINFLKNYGESRFIEDTAYYTLLKALPKHTAAYEAFIVHLDESDRLAISKAWTNYLYPDADHNKDEGDAFILIGYYTEADEPSGRNRALVNINKLLEHAKPR